MTPWFDYPQFNWPERHAIVIGAGIAGCQMTWHLSQLGWRVTLVEKEPEISTQASGNLAGVISPKMTAKASEGERFYQDAFNYTTRQLDTLMSADADIMWRPCGMLQLAHNKREQQRWESLKQRHLDSGYIQLLDQQKTSEVAGIRCNYPASYFPSAGYINPASFCQGLLSGSNHQLIHSTKVMQLRRDNNADCWKIHKGNDDILATAPLVIFCNGKYISEFNQSNFIPQNGVLGQTTHAISDTPEVGLNFPSEQTQRAALKCVIGHEGYLTPTLNGVNVFGATFDRQFDNTDLCEESDQRNFLQLQQYLPAFASKINMINSGHSAVRSTTPDRYPYVGGLPDPVYFQQCYQDLKHGRTNQTYPAATYQHGLFILGGFGSRGLTTSGYCAHLLSQLIENQTHNGQRERLNALHPARFLIRHLKRGIVG